MVATWFHPSMGVLFITLRCAGSQVMHIEITSPGYVQLNSGASLAHQRPALEAAVADCNCRFGGIFNFTLTVLTGPRNLQDVQRMADDSTDSLAQWYYQKRQVHDGISAIIAPGGTLDETNMHQLTAAWDILFFETVANTQSKYTLTGPPLLLTSYVSLPSLIKVTVSLLAMYEWTTVYLVVDSSSSQFYQVAGNETFRVGSSAVAAIWYRRTVPVNSMNASAIRETLKEFQLLSRVLLFLGRADQLRRFLIEAAYLKLTNGEFVYICMEPDSGFVKNFGHMSWRYGDDHDEEARIAFRSLLVVSPLDARSTSPAGIDLSTSFRLRTLELYNISHTPYDQPRDPLTTYTTVKMLCQVLNESLHSDGPTSLRDGRALARRFLNRTFTSDLGDIYIDQTGKRHVTLAVSHFTGDSDTYQAFLFESAPRNFVLEMTENISSSWPGGHWPPPNKPPCGYIYDPASCLSTSDSAIYTTTVVASLLVCLGIAAALICLVRVYLHRMRLQDFWWSLTSGDGTAANNVLQHLNVPPGSRIRQPYREVVSLPLQQRTQCCSASSVEH